MKPILDIAVPSLTFVLLFAVGTDLRATEFRRLRERPWVVLAGLAAPLVVLPLLAYLLVLLFRPTEAIAVGLLLVAACPIGGISNLYSYLARASTELSVMLTTLSCALAALSIPVLALGYERLLGVSLGLSTPMHLLAGRLLLLLAAPVGLGMWVRSRWPRLAEQQGKTLRAGTLIGLAVLLALVVASDGSRFAAELPQTAPLAAAMVAGSFLLGWGTGAALGAERADRFTLAAEFSTRNVAVAVVLAVTFLGRVEFATFATAYFLTEAPMLLAAVALVRPRLLGAKVQA